MFPQQSSSSPGRLDRDHGQQQHRLLSRSFNDYDAQASLPNMYPVKGQHRGPPELPMLTDGRTGSADGNWVLRAGFKMPRPQIL